MRIDKIASSAEYRVDERFQNRQFLENLEIYEFSKLDNSKNFKFRKFEKILISKLKKIQFENFQKFSFLKIF